VSVTYFAPVGEDPRFYSWWGGMDFAPHLLRVLAAPRQGKVRVVYHPPLRVADYSGRKQLAAEAEASVRSGHDSGADAGRVSPVR
jgi:1-acyl-sn-glycerol-3-phosphate acyltransferase